MDDRVWEELLQTNLVITPMVRSELGHWLNSTRNTPVRRAVQQADQGGHHSVQFAEVNERLKQHGYDYYMGLLGLRKIVGKMIADEFQAKHGRMISETQFSAQCSKLFGDRGFALAKKGRADFEKSNLFADEQLVVIAVLTSILAKTEIFILTRDHDILEQFYKLTYLLDTQYRAMLLADHYLAYKDNYVTHELPQDFVKRDGSFVLNSAIGLNPIYKTDNYLDTILPSSFHPVTLNCWWFGGDPNNLKVSSIAFSADQEMKRLLHIKSLTNGLNTDKLDGKNCHIHPFPNIPELEAHPVIALDKQRPVLGRQFIAVDFKHSLMSKEGFCVLKYSDLDSLGK
jgi:hypothetical protein